MKIIGFGVSKLLCEKNEVKQAKLNLSQNIEIKDLVNDTLPGSGEEIISIKFLFSVNYSDNLGKVEIAGNVVLLPEKEELKEIHKQWKEKSIPDGLKNTLFNFIMSKCNIKALSLEDEVGLPFHIPMPRLGKK